MFKHRSVEPVVNVPDDAGTEAQQRTLEQVVDVLDDAGGAQQRIVDQIVRVATETTEAATPTLDRAELDVTQRVIRAKAAPKILAECSLSRAVRLELERVRYEQQAQRRFKRAPGTFSRASESQSWWELSMKTLVVLWIYLLLPP